MKTIPHVNDWQNANRNQKIEDALLDQWFKMQWSIKAFGRTWEGTLSEIQPTPDVFFTIEIVDPNDTNVTLSIKAPFENFVAVGK